MSSTDRGHAVERKWMKRLQDEGRFACRPRWAGVDVVSLKAGEPTFFDEVKANTGNKPYMHFRAEDRALLLLAAEKAGAEARLVYWPPRQAEPLIVPSNAWPPPK